MRDIFVVEGNVENSCLIYTRGGYIVDREGYNWGKVFPHIRITDSIRYTDLYIKYFIRTICTSVLIPACRQAGVISIDMKHQSIYNRLRRIEGQIRGIEEMLVKERPDTDILIQLEAVKSSLSSTLANFIEEMLEKKEAEVKISETALRAILRSIKKS